MAGTVKLAQKTDHLKKSKSSNRLLNVVASSNENTLKPSKQDKYQIQIPHNVITFESTQKTEEDSQNSKNQSIKKEESQEKKIVRP